MVVSLAGPAHPAKFSTVRGCKADGVRQLVAIDLDGGPRFVQTLIAIWDDGDVALPLDRRLAPPGRQTLLDRARPHFLVTAQGHREAVDPDAPRLDSGDAIVVATSGSTGEPELLVHTRDGVAAHARSVHRRLELDRNRDRWLACLPLSHLGGLGVVVRALIDDVALDVWPIPDALAVSDAAANDGATLVSLVPTLADRVDLAGFRRVVIGGAADTARRPDNVVRTYGSTETGGGVVYDGVPLDGIEVRVDVTGAVAIRGETLARGRRAPTGVVTTITDEAGWFTTGDLGTWSDDGRLLVTGRADDLIISGGENIWPQPVEVALAAHPGVADVVVVGRSHSTWGQEVVAVVVPTDGARPPLLDELRDRVRADVSPRAAPRALVLVSEIPRTALGKPRRRELADQVAEPPAPRQ